MHDLHGSLVPIFGCFDQFWSKRSRLANCIQWCCTTHKSVKWISINKTRMEWSRYRHTVALRPIWKLDDRGTDMPTSEARMCRTSESRTCRLPRRGGSQPKTTCVKIPLITVTYNDISPNMWCECIANKLFNPYIPHTFDGTRSVQYKTKSIGPNSDSRTIRLTGSQIAIEWHIISWYNVNFYVNKISGCSPKQKVVRNNAQVGFRARFPGSNWKLCHENVRSAGVHGRGSSLLPKRGRSITQCAAARLVLLQGTAERL